jgi:hypothetical protein
MREYRAFEHQAYGYEADERERIVVEIFASSLFGVGSDSQSRG